MSLWSRLFRWRPDEKTEEVEPTAHATEDEPPKTIDLPVEPFVFECQSCGKVFEARRKRPQCPECDSTDVSLLSE
jgi:Zn finger protein HypA/HybF involved in hydrogenase expression